MAKNPKPTPAPPVKEQAALTIDLKPAPEAAKASDLLEQASRMIVRDKVTHSTALEFVRGAKQLQRVITDHWLRITRSIDDLKKNMLTLKNQDLEPVQTAIARAEAIILTYENAERARIREEEERQRRDAMDKARRDREAELARLEAQALEAEESSAELSDREQAFVIGFTQGIGVRGDAVASAERAGYKDPVKQAPRLMSTVKIQQAIIKLREANELRAQAAAKQAAPLEVEAPRVESQLGKAAGVRTNTYYSARVEDFDKLFDAVAAGKAPRSVLMVNYPELNAEARALKDSFEQAFPGCTLVKKQGLAG